MPRKVQNDFPTLLPGDFIAVEGAGRFSNLIRRCERTIPNPWRVGKATISHIALVYDYPIVIEAVGKIRLAPMAEYQNLRVEIYRYRGIDPEQRDKFCRLALGEWNNAYGWGKIFLFMLVALTRSYRIMNRLGITRLRVCSQYGAWIMGEILHRNMVDGFPWQTVDPQVCRDYQRSHKDQWELVYKTP